MKKVLLTILSPALFLLFACGNETAEEPTTGTIEEQTVEAGVDFFKEDDLYEFSSEGQLIFYATSFMEADEHSDSIVNVFYPTGLDVEEYITSFETVDELKQTLDSMTLRNYMFDSAPFIFYIKEEGDVLRMTTDSGRPEDALEPGAVPIEFIISPEENGLTFYVEDHPDERGEIKKVEHEEMFAEFVRYREELDSLTTNQIFNYLGAHMMVTDEFEWMTYTSGDNHQEVIKIPIDITNSLPTAYPIRELLPLINVYDGTGAGLEDMTAFYQEEDNYLNMGDQMIESGETARTYIFVATSPDNQYELVITNFITSRSVRFEATNWQ